MAYTVDILNAKKVADNGLLSKIQIGGKVYEVKDLIARENIGTLSAGLDKIAGDLAALKYVEATGQFEILEITRQKDWSSITARRVQEIRYASFFCKP